MVADFKRLRSSISKPQGLHLKGVVFDDAFEVLCIDRLQILIEDATLKTQIKLKKLLMAFEEKIFYVIFYAVLKLRTDEFDVRFCFKIFILYLKF